MTDDRIYQLALTMVNGVGDVISRQLLGILGSAEAIFKEKPQNLERIPGIGRAIINGIKDHEVMQKAEKELTFVEKNHISLHFFTDEDYPERLKECSDAPLLLYFKGNADLNSTHILSIVGTRKITDYGNSIITSFLKDISREIPDLLIVSGLAYGVDIKAHRESLRNNLSTVAVLAHGLDRIYPSVHRATAVEMLERGGLLTDFPSGTNPDRQNFVMRNRIVAGLSDATLVVESAEKGGSLITADIAFSYSREVFSFPGRINDPSSAGCNRIIKQNKAALITSATDVIEALNWSKQETKQKEVIQKSFVFMDCDLTLGEKQIIKIMEGEKNVHINQLARECSISVSDLSVLLFELEMKGCIQTMPGNLYRLM